MQKVKDEEGEVHALELGCGAGLFAMLAAKAGAISVVACDMHEPLCVATRKVGRLALPLPVLYPLLNITIACSALHGGRTQYQHPWAASGTDAAAAEV